MSIALHHLVGSINNEWERVDNSQTNVVCGISVTKGVECLHNNQSNVWLIVEYAIYLFLFNSISHSFAVLSREISR